MENRKYVRFSYELDMPYCNFDELKLLQINNDNILSAIEFNDSSVTLYFKEVFISQKNHSTEEIVKYAECRLFAIFLEIIKNSSMQKVKIKIEESYINDKKKIYLTTNISCGIISCSANMDVRRADGSIVTEKENKQMLLESNKNKMKQIILNSNGIMAIQEQDMQRLMKLFTVDDPVIKYLILYSWLSDLLVNQDNVNTFIKNSNTYAHIPDSFKNPPLRNNRNDETYFTYLRNLMGHTVTDALATSDAIIIEKVKTCTNWLFQILLEKLI